MNEASSPTALDFNIHSIKLGVSYLLIGTDSYLSDVVTDKLKAKLKQTADVDIFIIYGDSIKSSDLAEQLDTFSIFSSAKLVIIRNAEKLGTKELAILGDYFDSPSDIQTVVIVTDKIDIRFTAWKKIKAGCDNILCEPPRYGGAIRSWLDKDLKERGKTMTPRAIEEFVNRIELDYYSAANELTKLDLLVGKNKSITEIDVLKSLGTTRIGTLIDFYRALGKRQTKQALEAMDKMIMADWEPLQVFFQFQKFYHSIWRIILLRKAHRSDNEILTKYIMDIYATQRKEFMEFARQYSLSSIERIFSILMETDAQYKLSVADPQVLLSACLIKIMDT
ncbi:MAG: DNA polymerase III subunit delta [Candidatus Cloacimonetes bacterium]|nr:DNA polymerase III subunit delta [Candidatus Cloacimonadota bacterium]